MDNLGFESRQEQQILLYSKISRPALDSSSLTIQQIWGSFLGIKQPGCEVNHSLPSAGVKKECTYP